jgi:hypothetical protein
VSGRWQDAPRFASRSRLCLDGGKRENRHAMSFRTVRHHRRKCILRDLRNFTWSCGAETRSSRINPVIREIPERPRSGRKKARCPANGAACLRTKRSTIVTYVLEVRKVSGEPVLSALRRISHQKNLTHRSDNTVSFTSQPFPLVTLYRTHRTIDVIFHVRQR